MEPVYLEGSMFVEKLDLQMTFHQLLLKYRNSMRHLSEMRELRHVPVSRENVSLEQQRYRKQGVICNSAGKSSPQTLISTDFIFFFLKH